MKLHIAALLAAVTVASTSIVKSPPAEGNFELLILHNNDMHARFEQTSQLSGTCTTEDRDAGKCYGGFPRVATVVKEARQAAASGQGPPVLYLNAGDTYTGTAWFTIYKWKIAAEFINALQPDAVSLGNHEFDDGIDSLSAFIKNLTCPVLAANLQLSEVPELNREPNLKKSIVLDVRGTKVGIVGYLTPDTKLHTFKNNVDFTDEITAIKKETNNLKKNGVNIVIALGHSGYIKDQEIAREVNDIDLVIGGHSHSLLWSGTAPDTENPEGRYPTYVTQPSGRVVPVVQAYAYTKYLGNIQILFNSNGEITHTHGIPILLDETIPEDPEFVRILEHYRRQVHRMAGEVLGETSVPLVGNTCGKMECNMGNLITDAIIYYYAAHHSGENWTDVPIAFMQAGGIRSSIIHARIAPTTNITKEDLLTVMPFKGPLAIVSMNGTVLIEMLEHSVANYNQARAREFLQMSGMKVVYNYSKPIGERLVNAVVKCWECNQSEYFEIEPEKSYKIIMPAIIAQGGDGFKMLENIESQVLPYNEADCSEYYIREMSPISPVNEGRITILDSYRNKGNTTSLSIIAIITAIISTIVKSTDRLSSGTVVHNFLSKV